MDQIQGQQQVTKNGKNKDHRCVLAVLCDTELDGRSTVGFHTHNESSSARNVANNGRHD